MLVMVTSSNTPKPKDMPPCAQFLRPGFNVGSIW